MSELEGRIIALCSRASHSQTKSVRVRALENLISKLESIWLELPPGVYLHLLRLAAEVLSRESEEAGLALTLTYKLTKSENFRAYMRHGRADECQQLASILSILPTYTNMPAADDIREMAQKTFDTLAELETVSQPTGSTNTNPDPNLDPSYTLSPTPTPNPIPQPHRNPSHSSATFDEDSDVTLFGESSCTSTVPPEQTPIHTCGLHLPPVWLNKIDENWLLELEVKLDMQLSQIQMKAVLNEVSFAILNLPPYVFLHREVIIDRLLGLIKTCGSDEDIRLVSITLVQQLVSAVMEYVRASVDATLTYNPGPGMSQDSSAKDIAAILQRRRYPSKQAGTDSLIINPSLSVDGLIHKISMHVLPLLRIDMHTNADLVCVCMKVLRESIPRCVPPTYTACGQQTPIHTDILVQRVRELIRAIAGVVEYFEGKLSMPFGSALNESNLKFTCKPELNAVFHSAIDLFVLMIGMRSQLGLDVCLHVCLPPSLLGLLTHTCIHTSLRALVGSAVEYTDQLKSLLVAFEPQIRVVLDQVEKHCIDFGEVLTMKSFSDEKVCEKTRAKRLVSCIKLLQKNYEDDPGFLLGDTQCEDWAARVLAVFLKCVGSNTQTTTLTDAEPTYFPYMLAPALECLKSVIETDIAPLCVCVLDALREILGQPNSPRTVLHTAASLLGLGLDESSVEIRCSTLRALLTHKYTLVMLMTLYTYTTEPKVCRVFFDLVVSLLKSLENTPQEITSDLVPSLSLFVWCATHTHTHSQTLGTDSLAACERLLGLAQAHAPASMSVGVHLLGIFLNDFTLRKIELKRLEMAVHGHGHADTQTLMIFKPLHDSEGENNHPNPSSTSDTLTHDDVNKLLNVVFSTSHESAERSRAWVCVCNLLCNDRHVLQTCTTRTYVRVITASLARLRPALAHTQGEGYDFSEAVSAARVMFELCTRVSSARHVIDIGMDVNEPLEGKVGVLSLVRDLIAAITREHPNDVVWEIAQTVGQALYHVALDLVQGNIDSQLSELGLTLGFECLTPPHLLKKFFERYCSVVPAAYYILEGNRVPEHDAANKDSQTHALELSAIHSYILAVKFGTEVEETKDWLRCKSITLDSVADDFGHTYAQKSSLLLLRNVESASTHALLEIALSQTMISCLASEAILSAFASQQWWKSLERLFQACPTSKKDMKLLVRALPLVCMCVRHMHTLAVADVVEVCELLITFLIDEMAPLCFDWFCGQVASPHEVEYSPTPNTKAHKKAQIPKYGLRVVQLCLQVLVSLSQVLGQLYSGTALEVQRLLTALVASRVPLIFALASISRSVDYSHVIPAYLLEDLCSCVCKLIRQGCSRGWSVDAANGGNASGVGLQSVEGSGDLLSSCVNVCSKPFIQDTFKHSKVIAHALEILLAFLECGDDLVTRRIHRALEGAAWPGHMCTHRHTRIRVRALRILALVESHPNPSHNPVPTLRLEDLTLGMFMDISESAMVRVTALDAHTHIHTAQDIDVDTRGLVVSICETIESYTHKHNIDIHTHRHINTTTHPYLVLGCLRNLAKLVQSVQDLWRLTVDLRLPLALCEIISNQRESAYTDHNPNAWDEDAISIETTYTIPYVYQVQTAALVLLRYLCATSVGTNLSFSNHCASHTSIMASLLKILSTPVTTLTASEERFRLVTQACWLMVTLIPATQLKGVSVLTVLERVSVQMKALEDVHLSDSQREKSVLAMLTLGCVVCEEGLWEGSIRDAVFEPILRLCMSAPSLQQREMATCLCSLILQNTHTEIPQPTLVSVVVFAADELLKCVKQDNSSIHTSTNTNIHTHTPGMMKPHVNTKWRNHPRRSRDPTKHPNGTTHMHVHTRLDLSREDVWHHLMLLQAFARCVAELPLTAQIQSLLDCVTLTLNEALDRHIQAHTQDQTRDLLSALLSSLCSFTHSPAHRDFLLIYLNGGPEGGMVQSLISVCRCEKASPHHRDLAFSVLAYVCGCLTQTHLHTHTNGGVAKTQLELVWRNMTEELMARLSTPLTLQTHIHTQKHTLAAGNSTYAQTNTHTIIPRVLCVFGACVEGRADDKMGVSELVQWTVETWIQKLKAYGSETATMTCLNGEVPLILAAALARMCACMCLCARARSILVSDVMVELLEDLCKCETARDQRDHKEYGIVHIRQLAMKTVRVLTHHSETARAKLKMGGGYFSQLLEHLDSAPAS